MAKSISKRMSAGLTDIVDGNEAFNNKVNDLLKETFKAIPIPKYNKVLIVDTFFSDTLNGKILSEIFQLSKKWNTEIRIALLDPFISQAFERAEIFKPDTSITRINKGLYRIKNALAGNSSFNNIDYEQNCNKKHYIFKQVEQINSLKRDGGYSNIQIKFTSDYKFPLFIFDQYACSGYYLSFNTAAKLPWCIWEDDGTKTKDQYSNFAKHFSEIWNDSSELSKKHLTNSAKNTAQNMLSFANRKILVAYSREDVRNKVLIECRNAGLAPKEFF